jgi:magnesium transporter
VSLFFGERYVVTFQEREGDCFEPVRNRIRRARGRLRENRPDYLAYALLDAVIDAYFPIVEAYGDRLEALEDRVLEEPTSDVVSEIHAVKRELSNIRRAVWPLRDVVNLLLREQHPLLREDTRLYLRDAYDHTIQLVELVESHREIASGLLDVYLSSVSNRMNEVMKVLTIIATIFIPLSFVAGLYGMNFDRQASAWNMPELSWDYGYPAALGVMLAIALGMLWFFRRKRWL